MTCRQWLLENKYEDFAALVDQALEKIRAKSRRSRRNWWDTFAGGPDGKPSIREGIEFPVLRAAQIRQGKPITPNAICRSEDEQPPDVVATKGWPRKKLPSKVNRLAKKGRRIASREPKAS